MNLFGSKPSRLLFCLLVSVVFSRPDSAGAQQPAQNAGNAKLKATIDYCRFRYSDSHTFFEFSASLDRLDLIYIPDEKGFKAEFLVTAEVFAADSLIGKKMWKNINNVDSLQEIYPGQRLYCLNNFVLPNGDYEMKITFEDPQNPDSQNSYDFPVSLPGFADSNLIVSDLQIASTIERDTVQSIYVKNGYRVYPNPSALYGLTLPILYSYAEIYNLAEATSDSGAIYRTTYRVINADGQVVKEISSRDRKKPGASAVEVSASNVVTLISGAYYIQLVVTDLETGQSTQTMRKFFVYREQDYAEGGAVFQKTEEVKGGGSPGMDAGRYDVMSEKDLDKEFEYARYISEKQERDTFKKLNHEGKKKFIREFWAKRDPNPASPENDVKRDYLGRVEMANTKYRGNFREGWRTDRGRILLVYGRPDEIERFPFSNQNRTYEVWHFFSVQGGVDFIFVDKREMGDLELVHSSARGEIYDPEWTRWINPSGGSSSMDGANY